MKRTLLAFVILASLSGSAEAVLANTLEQKRRATAAVFLQDPVRQAWELYDQLVGSIFLSTNQLISTNIFYGAPNSWHPATSKMLFWLMAGP